MASDTESTGEAVGYVNYRKGDSVFLTGAPSESKIFYVAKGSVDLSLGGPEDSKVIRSVLEGQFFGGDSVGLDLEIKSPCLDANALLVSDESLQKVRMAATAKEQRALLRSVLKQSSRAARLPSTIRLSVDRGNLLFFDYKLFRLLVARKSDELSTPRVPVCVTYPFRDGSAPSAEGNVASPE